MPIWDGEAGDAVGRGPATALERASPAKAHVLYVCTGCNFSKTEEERLGVRGGRTLWDALMAEADRQGGAAVHIEPTACLSVCKDSCAAAITAPGKYALTFGWLHPESAAADLLCFARQYAAAPEGHVPRAERPPATRRLISRVPPYQADPDLDDDPRNPRSAAQVEKPRRPW